jgi:hypothetical protein
MIEWGTTWYGLSGAQGVRRIIGGSQRGCQKCAKQDEASDQESLDYPAID